MDCVYRQATTAEVQPSVAVVVPDRTLAEHFLGQEVWRALGCGGWSRKRFGEH